jgi:hypothetical protein
MATRSVSSGESEAAVTMQASSSQQSLSQRMKRGRNWLLALVATLILSQMLVAQPNPASTSAKQGQPTSEELTYIQRAFQTYVIGTLVSGNIATATIRLNGENRHVPLRQGVLGAYGVSKRVACVHDHVSGGSGRILLDGCRRWQPCGGVDG